MVAYLDDTKIAKAGEICRFGAALWLL